MKRVLFGIFFLFCFINYYSQTCDLDSEGFETGVTPAGWVQNGTYINNIDPFAGTYKAGFNSEGDNLIIEALNCPGQICFYWRTSGSTSNHKIELEWSDDNKVNWNSFNRISTTDSSIKLSYRRTCFSLPTSLFSNSSQVFIRFRQHTWVSGSFYLDDVCISSGNCNIKPKKFTIINLSSGCIAQNTPFSLTVCATDSFNNIANTYNGTVSLVENSGLATLSGTTTKTFTNGCATYDNLILNSSGKFVIKADSGTIISRSDSITIKTLCPVSDSLVVMSYNLLNFPDGRNDCGTNIQPLNRQDTLKRIVQYIKPDVFMACEMNNSSGADLILNSCLNINGETKFARANYVANASGDVLGNMIYFNTDKLTFIKQSEIITGESRHISEFKFFANDPNLTVHKDTTFLNFYTVHLKAGTTFFTDRNKQVDSLILHINKQPLGKNNNIIGGDFNIYGSTEPEYINITTNGTYPFSDPLGTWVRDDITNALKYTQSTRAFGDTYIECGADGGMDDRFDMILVSDTMMNTVNRVYYKKGSYRNIGNDNSNVHNKRITDPSNTGITPDSIKKALYYFSDHLPVKLTLEVNYPIAATMKLQKSNLLSHNKIVDNKIEIFPNPTNSEIHLKGLEKDNIVYIFDLYGRVVFETNVERNDELTLDLTHLSSGTFVVKIKTTSNTIYKKIIKQN